jgi:Spy/CpxP family protein refolding chaperone
VKRWLAILALLSAAGAWGAPIDGKWWKDPRIVRELSLTPPQVDRIEAIFLRARPELIDLRADFEKERLRQESTMQQPEVDPREAEKRIDEVEAARSRLAKARMEMFLEIRRVLSPEQRERVRSLIGDRREGRPLRQRPRSD